MSTIKIAIAEDEVLFLEGLSMIIKSFKDLELIIEAQNGQELIAEVEKRIPDVILLDYQMPVQNGLEAMLYLKDKYPDIKIIILTMFEEEEIIAHFMQNGADGYLIKGHEDSLSVKEAIEKVTSDQKYYTSYVGNAIVNRLLKVNKRNNIKFLNNDGVHFTERQKEILFLLCKGMGRKKIARELFLTERAIDFHIRNLKKLTNTGSTQELVIYLHRKNFCDNT